MTGVFGSFPVPAGAKVAENVSTSSGIGIMFSKVTPAKVPSFYAQALPRAGYTITGNSVLSGSAAWRSSVHRARLQGHISTMAKVTGDTLPGLGPKNVTAISLQPK